MIVAIDGTAASGKSTVAKRLAQRVGAEYLDTGAIYRALTWKALREGVAGNADALVELAEGIELRLETDRGQDEVRQRVFVGEHEVTEAIRTPEVDAHVSHVSKVPGVRRAMVGRQRRFAMLGPDLVAEGRDIGTAVFPEAELKVFVTASPEERARRRAADLERQGVSVDLGALEEELRRRDEIDSTREVGPLTLAADAIEIDTTSRAVDDVVAELQHALYVVRIENRPPAEG